MERLLLVDGSNLLFQMFYGMPSRITNKEGKPIQGILGFVGALRKIITATHPTHICVLFDGEHENPRSILYEEYKSNRIDYSSMPLEDTPFSQLPEIYKALDCLKISYKELTDYETDDYIATYTKLYQSQMEIVISSWDSDYFSLIGDKVKIYRYRGKNSYFCDIQYLNDKLHITPNKYIFYKSLVGDSADNIKGVHKVGPVTATKIVNSYSSIEELYNHIDSCRYQNLLKDAKEQLLLNEKLISFHILNSLPFSVEDLKWNTRDFETNTILKKIGAF
ncbi:MAG: hypothetical protein K2K48_04300 [Anaeroplasmataceae bacterium]|nr:hypothetical protein [Anaeroplasmataceae bacterium]MDE6414613.1 hypothetical protein [Anaeroplasmataceae bacterium]